MAEDEDLATVESSDPSRREQQLGLARDVLGRAADAYGFEDGRGLEFAMRDINGNFTIEDPRDLDANASAAFTYAYSEFIDELLADPNNLDLIYGAIQADGTRDGGNPELWMESRRFADNSVHDYMMQPDGFFRARVSNLNFVTGELEVDRQSSYMLNRPGMHHTRDLHHPNGLSVNFLDRFLPLYAEANNIADLLPESGTTEEIADVVAAEEQRLQNLLRAATGEEDIDDLYEGLTNNTYDAEALRRRVQPEQRESVDEIIAIVSQLHALKMAGEIAASRDLAGYLSNGRLPDFEMSLNGAPALNRFWTQAGEGRAYENDDGSLRWEALSEFRVWDADVYQRATTNTLNTAMFADNPAAANFIAAQGWGADAGMSIEQFSALTRHMMIVEAAGRHGIDDPNSAEARAAFMQDYREGYFHLHDIEFAFAAGDYTNPHALNQAIAAQRERFDLADDTPRDHIMFDSPSIEVREDAFQEMFGVDVQLADASGGVINVENATLTTQEAVDYFFRMPSTREAFGYSFNQQFYGTSYEELLEMHGDEVSERTGLTVAETIANIMENVSAYRYYQLTHSADGGPGDFVGDFQRTYLANYQERLQEQHLIENEHLPEPETPDYADTPAPVLERDAALFNEESPQPIASVVEEKVTPDMVAAASAEIVVPPPEMVAAMEGFTPEVHPGQAPRPV